jgi:NAD(P)-dependent dehydrogenase (short-subunit alcohol dehydrogenase family)
MPTDQTALVTGAGSGIGRATAARLARAGWSVALADVDETAVLATHSELVAKDARARPYVLDVTDGAACADVVGRVVADLGPVTAVVTCAGVLASGRLAETSAEDWDRVFDVNVKGTFLVCRAVIPQMVAAGGGVIVTLASAAGVAAVPELAAYSASKGAVVSLTRSIALDYGAAGIRANCVCPGVVDTPMKRDSEGDDQHALDLAAAAREHVLGRVAVADEVAALVGFLVSDDCSFMTGSAVLFDGGFTMPTMPTMPPREATDVQ